MSVTKKIEKMNKKYGADLETGETVIAFSAPFILLTNARLIELNVDDEFGNFFPLSEIDKVTRHVESWLNMSLIVSLNDGTVTEIRAVLNDQDWGDFEVILKGALEEQDPGILANAEPTDTQTYGFVAAQGLFGTKHVTIYSKGFVSVASGMGLFNGQIEELLDIFGETDVNKKTGLGRGVAAAITMGASLALSPNQRGNLYLTIATNRQTHSLFWEIPNESSIKTLNQLVSAGKAAISVRNSKAEGAKFITQQASSLEVQLQQLADLHSKGLLDDAEFKASKAKLLGL